MKLDIILDSGAFSAWTKQTTIDIEAYTNFCLKWLDKVNYVVSVDVIPGKFGQKQLSQEVREESARQGWENYLYMRGRGIPVEKLIHVFHQGEEFYWLERMIAEMPYIGLSPANDRTTKEKYEWLHLCMKYVTDPKGMPIVKFHGFAVTSHMLMTRFPWASVDSTAWVHTSRYGTVWIPKKIGGKYDFVTSPHKIVVSDRSPSLDNVGKHFTTLEKAEQQEVLSYLETLSVSMEELQSEYRRRDFVNVRFMVGLAEQLPWPRPFRRTATPLEIE